MDRIISINSNTSRDITVKYMQFELFNLLFNVAVKNDSKLSCVYMVSPHLTDAGTRDRTGGL